MRRLHKRAAQQRVSAHNMPLLATVLIVCLGLTLSLFSASAQDQQLQVRDSASNALLPIARFQEKLKKGAKPYDQPGEAQAFYARKRVPLGEAAIPVERYAAAIQKIQQMSLFDTGLNAYVARESVGPLKSASLTSWSALGPGNIGGRTRALVINPNNPSTMYAGGVAGGVWKTGNAGASWTPLDDLMANLAVNALAMSPANASVLYAGTGEGFFNNDAVRGAGIFKTTNAGASWHQLVNTNNSNFYYVNDIVVSPNSANRVYAATRTGVWRSSNAGTNWSQVHNPGINGGCLDLAIRTDQANDYIFASCGNFAQATVYRNTDAAGAGTWDPVLTEASMGRTSLAIAPSDQTYIYALSASIAGGNYNNGLHKVFRSTNGGSIWSTRVANTDSTKLNTLLLTNPVIADSPECGLGDSQFLNQGWYDNVIAVDPSNREIVWAGGIDLFRSNDGGQNWGLASYWWLDPTMPDYVHADQHVIVFHPNYNGSSNQTMYVGNDGGVHRTTNARAAVSTGATATCSNAGTNVNWTELNNNYGVTQFYHGIPYPNGTSYFGGTQDNGTLRGNDTTGSEQWVQLLGGDGGYVAVDFNNTQVLYASTQNGNIFKSTDGGNTFPQQPATTGIDDDGLLFITPYIMDPNNSQRLWTGGWFLWRTDNAANNWTQASTLTTGSGSVSAIAVAPSNEDYILAGMDDGFIHRTTAGTSSDNTTNWPFNQPAIGYVSWVAFDPNNHNIAYATYSSFGVTHVWRSTNAGGNWSPLEGSGAGQLPDIPVHSIVVDPNDSARLYIGTDLGVFVSTDTGATWAQENTGFANVVTESLAINPVGGGPDNYLFAFTHGRGAWRVLLNGDCEDTDILNLSNQTITGVEDFVACTSISAGPNFKITGTGDVSFTAGTSIVLRSGFSVANNGRFQAILGSP